MILWRQSAAFCILNVSSQRRQMWHPPWLSPSSSLNESTVHLENLWIVSRALHADVTLFVRNAVPTLSADTIPLQSM